MSCHPVVLCFPYLPMKKAVEFGEWWLGPLRAYEGPWAIEGFEARVRQFLAGFTLAAALKEYGLLRRTIYAARYLSDPAYRRRITRQLNKGESLHALRRDLCYAHEGQVRHRHHEGQSEQALCLTVVVNAIVAWTTEYMALAVGELRAGGREIDDAVLAHVSPAHNENIGFYGTFSIEVDRELAQLVGGYRPLRQL